MAQFYRRMIMNKYIYPGQPMKDTDGNIIQAHGAGMIYDNGVYYWYGENKEFTTGDNDVWTWGIRFYSSTDLLNWKNEGIIIKAEPEKPESSLSGAFFRLFLRVFYWIGRYSGFFSLNRT